MAFAAGTLSESDIPAASTDEPTFTDMTIAEASDEVSAGETSETAQDDATTTEKPRHKARNSGTKRGVNSVKNNVNVISVAAAVLEISEDEVRSAVKTGKVGDLLIVAEKVAAFKAAYLIETKSKLDAAVTAGTLTQEQAETKYMEAQEKMEAYDGTTHLCGGADHSKMFNRTSDSKSQATELL
jgi:hypothetical protein